MTRRNAFTLVELLVVIAIIGILVALLLPAVQVAREAARRTQCKSQLKQMALASLNFEGTFELMPSSGWGWRWQPDAEAGFGPDQPGGWTFNVLPFMEEQALRDIAQKGETADETQQNMLRLVTSTVEVFNCPSRRGAALYTFETDDSNANGVLAINMTGCESGNCSVARTDYASNGGNATAQGDLGNQGPPNAISVTLGLFDNWLTKKHNGVMFQRSKVRLAQITDGTSKTTMIGEKYISTDNYDNGASNGDDQNIFVGHDSDNIRYTGIPNVGAIGPAKDDADLYPMGTNRNDPGTKTLNNQGSPGDPTAPIFGSAHPGALNMAFCDGSVQTISYDIDERVYFFYGGRNDDGDVYPGD